MPYFIQFVRFIAKCRFKYLGRASILDIKTQILHRLIKELQQNGWEIIYEYSGYDVWIDYAQIKLRKGSYNIMAEWDNWAEGSLEGSRAIIEIIALENNLSVSSEWRWSIYDDKF